MGQQALYESSLHLPVGIFLPRFSAGVVDVERVSMFPYHARLEMNNPEPTRMNEKDDNHLENVVTLEID